MSEGPLFKSDAARRYFLQSSIIGDFMGQLMKGTAATAKCHIDYIESEGKYGWMYDGAEGDPIHAGEMLDNFLCSMVLTRIVDNFLSYLTEVLEVIFKCEPNLLRGSDDGYKLEFILSHQTMDELLASIAESKVENLSRQSMQNLAEYFKSKLGVEVFRNQDELRDGVKLNEVRNLIVHQRGVVSKRFAARYPDLKAAPGDVIGVDKDLVAAAYDLFKLAVMNTDINASRRFKFPPPTLP